jgi:hypothetical protein
MTDISKQYNLDNSDLDSDELLDDLFNYMLELDGTDITSFSADDAIKEISVHDGLKISKIDDSKKETCNRFYFNGKNASHQTCYERLSNHYKICTVAKTDKVGKALHTFLRVIIDPHDVDEWLNYVQMTDNYKKDTYTLNEIIDILEKRNSEYCSLYDIHDDIHIKGILNGHKSETYIKRFIGDVDMWDIYRIAHVLGVWTSTERYKNLPF